MPEDQQQQQGEETPKEERTFTQAEVENIVRGRLAKFSDYDDLKARLDALEAEGKSEQDKAVDAARKEARAEALAEFQTVLVTSEARTLAAETGWLYPQDAPRYIDAKAIKVNEDGTVDSESVKQALADAVKDRPALIKQAGPEVPPAENAGIGYSAPPKPRTVEDAWAAALKGTRT